MKYVRLLVVAIMLLALVYVLDQCGETSSLAKPTAAPKAQPATPPAPNKAAAQVAPPVLPPAPTTSSVGAPAAPEEGVTIADSTPGVVAPSTEPALDPTNPQPQVKLEDAISLAVMVYENGDFLTMAKLMHPNATPEEQETYAETLRSAPNATALVPLRVQALQVTQLQTPEMNADGTQAVYNFDPPIGPFTAAIFVKENGLWHKM